jgi:hypothetical protein
MKKLFTAILLLLASNLSAEDGFVIVTGVGASEDLALQNAFITAVEQQLGIFVSTEVLVENGDLIKDNVRTNSQGFIEQYSIISSGKDKDLFVVTIKAKVSAAKINAQMDEISHINDAAKSYAAVECRLAYKNAVMCKGGDISISNMNFGIYADSVAFLRHYMGDITETQLYVRLTLREKGYFYSASGQDGREFELRYVDNMGGTTSGTVTEDFIISLSQNDSLEKLKPLTASGLILKLTGSKKILDVKVPAPYIDGFLRYIGDRAWEKD